MDLKLLILNSVGAFQLLLIIILLIHKGRNKLSNRFLIVFFFAQFMAYANILLVAFFYEITVNKLIFALLKIPFSYLWGPCLYFYIISDHNFKFKFKPRHYLHFLPAFLIFIYFIYLTFAYNNISFEAFIDDIQRRILNIAMIVQIIIYNGVAAYIVEKNSKAWNYGNIDKSRIKWNKFILYGYISACLLYNITSIVYEFHISTYTFVLISSIIFLAYFNVIIYKALTTHHIFSLNTLQNNLVSESEELSSSLKDLEEYMVREKPYLDFDLTLNELARQLKLTAPALSKLIKQYKNQNFYDFINTYRIEEAKKLISDSGESKKTIQEIMYECGYNSKSSFNTAFKKVTGETPTSYRKQFHKTPAG